MVEQRLASGVLLVPGPKASGFLLLGTALPPPHTRPIHAFARARGMLLPISVGPDCTLCILLLGHIF